MKLAILNEIELANGSLMTLHKMSKRTLNYKSEYTHEFAASATELKKMMKIKKRCVMNPDSMEILVTRADFSRFFKCGDFTFGNYAEIWGARIYPERRDWKPSEGKEKRFIIVPWLYNDIQFFEDTKGSNILERALQSHRALNPVAGRPKYKYRERGSDRVDQRQNY